MVWVAVIARTGFFLLLRQSREQHFHHMYLTMINSFVSFWEERTMWSFQPVFASVPSTMTWLEAKQNEKRHFIISWRCFYGPKLSWIMFYARSCFCELEWLFWCTESIGERWQARITLRSTILRVSQRRWPSFRGSAESVLVLPVTNCFSHHHPESLGRLTSVTIIYCPVLFLISFLGISCFFWVTFMYLQTFSIDQSVSSIIS